MIQAKLILALVMLVLGAGSGWFINAKFEAAARAELLEQALVQQREAVQRAIDEAAALRALDSEILAESSARQAEVREVTKYITKEVKVYVPEKTDCACNLTVGAVGLLNDARQPDSRADRAGVPIAAEGADEALLAPSTLTLRDEVTAHIECAAQYNELAIQHDALIDWIEKANDQQSR